MRLIVESAEVAVFWVLLILGFIKPWLVAFAFAELAIVIIIMLAQKGGAVK
jgi:hypothetical protein